MARTTVNILEVKKGDTILEGKNRTEVEIVDAVSCKGKVHINDRDCYERAALVDIQV